MQNFFLVLTSWQMSVWWQVGQPEFFVLYLLLLCYIDFCHFKYINQGGHQPRKHTAACTTHFPRLLLFSFIFSWPPSNSHAAMDSNVQWSLKLRPCGAIQMRSLLLLSMESSGKLHQVCCHVIWKSLGTWCRKVPVTCNYAGDVV